MLSYMCMIHIYFLINIHCPKWMKRFSLPLPKRTYSSFIQDLPRYKLFILLVRGKKICYIFSPLWNCIRLTNNRYQILVVFSWLWDSRPLQRPRRSVMRLKIRNKYHHTWLAFQNIVLAWNYHKKEKIIQWNLV